MKDVDIVFNGDDFSWSTSGESGKMDVQNIATHEIGHFLGLDDLYSSSDSEATMYGYAAPGETKKRTLTEDDKNGIRFLYPKMGDLAVDVNISMINNLIDLNKRESCSIGFELVETKRVKIKIYTIDGELVKKLVDDSYPAGNHWVLWSGENDEQDEVGAGIYLVKFNLSDKIFKIAVIK